MLNAHNPSLTQQPDALVEIKTQAPDFHQLDTTLKINPHSQLLFDGTEMVTLQNMASEKGLNIKYDIMLILFMMVDWVSVEKLISGWPTSDQEKIINYLKMMHDAKFIITPNDEKQAKQEKALAEKPEPTAGSGINFHLGNHLLMLQDTTRIRAYEKAIQKVIQHNTTALDLGTGTGILAMLCAKAGAQKVYAIERQTEVAKVAQAIFEKNNVSEKITILGGRSQNIPETAFETKPDVLVSEILGDSIFNEMILEFTIDARNRFLAEGGKLIPAKIEVWGVPFESSVSINYPQQVQELEDAYGLDFSPLKAVINHRISCREEDFVPHIYKLLADPICLAKADLKTLQEPILTGSPEFTCTQTGQLKGVCLYFKVWMDDEETIALSNSPWGPKTHWSQMVINYTQPLSVEKDQAYQAHFKYQGHIELEFTPSQELLNQTFIKII